MTQVEPVANLMGGGAAQMKGWGGCTDIPKISVIDDDAVGSGVTARKLGVAQQSSGKVTNPDIEIIAGGPCVVPARRSKLNRIAGTAKAINRSRRPGDAGGGITIGVYRSQAKFDLRIGGLRPGVIGIGIHPPEILIEYVDLAQYLSVAYVFGAVVEYHVDGHRYSGHPGDCTVGSRQRPFGKPLNGVHSIQEARILALQVFQVFHRSTIALLGKGAGVNEEE